jgi:dephospho-CoA kinase
MKIIAFTGMPFSGKSEAVKIAKEMNISVVRMGDMVWEETKSQGFEINDSSVGKVANDMRKEQGMNIWAQKTFKKIKNIQYVEKLVIDGIRNIEEVEFFKKNLGKKFILITVKVSEEIRYKRAIIRGRKDDSTDIKKIKERDQRELNWGIEKVIDSSDITIVNENGIDAFHKKVKEILKDL